MSQCWQGAHQVGGLGSSPNQQTYRRPSACAPARHPEDFGNQERPLGLASPLPPRRPTSLLSRPIGAGATGFFIFNQSGERPERYIESLRFDTTPSRPILQAWAKTVGPSPSICSLNRMPADVCPAGRL